MGYDMYVVEEDNTRPTELNTLPDEGKWQDAYEKWKVWFSGVEERNGYYRLNIWGMGYMRTLLDAGGCINYEATVNYDDPEATEHDTGGVLPGYKISDNSGWHVSPAECMATALRWFEGGGREQARQEATEMAAEWANNGDPHTPDQVLAWADDFVQWIGFATSRGGFRVY